MKNYLKIYLLIFFTVFCSFIKAQNIHYSPAYFGPNANPVPEFDNATIPLKTTVKISGDYYFGFGDNTANITLGAEIPLLSKYFSLKMWVNTLEYYKVTQKVYDERNMEGDKLSGSAGGDFYIQTRILILPEKKYIPNVILNLTSKTASGTNFKQRRYFDTPSYYFDLEAGKSIYFKNNILNEIRVIGNIGFLCWETSGSKQNDAPMYGGKIILSNSLFNFENTLSGYSGWMNNGDKPLVYSSKLIYKQPNINIFVQYQYGIKDFPYHHIQAGVAFTLSRLTPVYKRE